jgi:hypothetical protein
MHFSLDNVERTTVEYDERAASVNCALTNNVAQTLDGKGVDGICT